MAITLVKTGTPNPVVVGQPLTYTITITSLGPGPANNVVLTDLLPPTVTFVSASVPCTPVGNVLTCNLGNIPQGTTRTITIVATPNAPGMITNVATAQGSGQNMAQDVETTQVLQATTLSILKLDSPDPASVGAPLTYTVSITNTGMATAEGVVLTDDLPDSVLFVSSSVPCALGPGNVLTCTIGSIPPGNTVGVTITVVPTAPGMITNTATAVGVNAAAVTDTEITQVILSADLAVTKTANPTAQVGQGLTYLVTVTNNGPSTATGVTVVDTLPAGVRFVSATPSQGTCSVVGQTVTCLIGTLGPGEAETISILVVPTRPGPLTNTVMVFGNEVDPNPANNTASLTVNAFQCFTGFF